MSSKGSKPQDPRSSGQEKSKERKSDWSALGLLADTIDGFFSWSFTIQLPGTLFFFPCVKMAWSGSEVALCAGILAIFLAFTRIRWWTLRYYWFFRVIALMTGLASKYADPVEYQILVLGLANGLDWLSLFGFWRSNSSERRSQSLLGFLLGFVAFLSISMAYRSLNPIWEFELANHISIGVALFACLLHFLIESKKDYSQALITPSATAPSSLTTGLGLGALCFLFCNYMAGHGIISRWVELPTFPHGSIVIATTILGIFLSFILSGFVQSWIWWAMTALAGWTLLCSGLSHGQEHRQYIEFVGGLLLVLYGSSTWTVAIEKLSKVNRPGTAMFVAVLTMTVLNVWGVYVVAYKFVPGGEILRERSISLSFLTVVLCSLTTSRVVAYGKTTGLSFAKVFLPIVLISALALAPAHYYRLQRSLSNPTVDPSPDSLRAMIWATHFGYDNNGGINMQELAKTMKDAKVNVVGLVETDCSRAFFSNRDVVEFVSEELGFYSDYGPSTATNTWGCALLSAYPILRSDRIILPSPEGELACLIDADLLVNGTSVNVLVTHFGNTEDELDRKLQADAVMEMARNKKDKYTPTILIGYLTSAPYTNYYPPLIESGWRDSLNSLDRYCEYILYKDMKVQNFERIDKGNISDTEAQVGTFVIEPIEEYNTRWSRSPTPQFCRAIGTDSVACQREVHCAWCQYGTQGVCLEPQMKQVCESFQGIFLGEKTEQIAVSDQSRKDFVSLFYEGQLNGLYPLKKIDGNTWEWTINDFNYLRSYVRTHTSSPFEWEGQLWRLSALLPNPKWNPSDAFLDVAIESLDAKKYQGLVTVSFNLKTIGTKEIKNIGAVNESRNAFRAPKRSRRITSVDLVQNHFYTNEADAVTIQVNLKLQ